MRIRGRRGQTGTEYAIMISTVVVAVAAAAYVYIPVFKNGVTILSLDVSQILEEHGSVKQGWGVAASSASGGGNHSNSLQGSSQTLGAGLNNGAAPNGGPDSTITLENAAGGGF